MSELQKITLTQFRNFNHLQLAFSKKLIGIVGKNGSGKTNILDAIYYLCYTKSYFQSKEINNATFHTNGFRIEGYWKIDSGTEKTVALWKDGKKSVEHDGIPYERVTEHIGKFNAIFIAPDDIAIINEGSDLRRKFFDALLSMNNNQYLSQLLQYQKILQQKNAYLKKCNPQTISHDLLDVFDQQLAKSGDYLIEKRLEAQLKIPQWVQYYYTEISKNNESVAISYRPSNAAAPLLEIIYRSRIKDIELKRSTIGPHTEDFIFHLNNNPIKTFGSQGQKKSFLISLKLAQLKWLQDLGEKPILLLDDIFEKLDEKRLEYLFELLQQFPLAQILMTHTNEQDLEKTISNFYHEIEFIKL